MLSEAERARLDAQVAAHEAGHREQLNRLRSLSFQERAEIFEGLCDSAMEILRSRKAAGLPDSKPAPWPESTWEILRKDAANVRRRSTS
jgi:hypothetical protein